MLICIMAVVVAFLVNAVMPIFSGIYEQMGINIEADAMIQAALLIGNIAMWTIFAILLFAIVIFIFSKTNPGKRALLKTLERSLITRRLHETLSVAHFTSAFSTLLEAGDEMIPALQMAREVSGSQKVMSRLEGSSEKMQKGRTLADTLVDSGLFSTSHEGMLRSGDRAGVMPKVLRKLSDIYTSESERLMSRFISLMEPALIGVLSVVIGVILLCIMLPLIGILAAVG